MWHYGLFLGAMPTASLSEDGNPPRGALRLCPKVERLVGAIKTFRIRAEAPLFAGLPVAFKAATNGATCQIVAQRCNRATAMIGSAAS